MLRLFLIIGVACVIISGIFIRAWTGGEQQRADFYSETKEQRNLRTTIGLYSGLVCVVSLGIAGLIYIL